MVGFSCFSFDLVNRQRRFFRRFFLLCACPATAAPASDLDLLPSIEDDFSVASSGGVFLPCFVPAASLLCGLSVRLVSFVLSEQLVMFTSPPDGCGI